MPYLRFIYLADHEQTKRHPEKRKYVTYRNAARYGQTDTLGGAVMTARAHGDFFLWRVGVYFIADVGLKSSGRGGIMSLVDVANGVVRFRR